MLTKSDRETYFRLLGLGEYNKENILKVQKKYFKRKEDHDGKYGSDTDKLIVNLYRIKMFAPHFKITEFVCHCNGKYCTGYPDYLDVYLLKYLEKIRTKFGGPINVASGLRCAKWNAEQSGSATKSRHITGKAADINGTLTSSAKKRDAIKKYWYTLNRANYCYHGTKNMGTSIHVDVK